MRLNKTAAANKTGGEIYSIDVGWGAHLRLYPQGEGLLEKEPRFHFIEAARACAKPCGTYL